MSARTAASSATANSRVSPVTDDLMAVCARLAGELASFYDLITACAALTGFGMLCASLLRLRSAGREGRSAAGPAAGIAAGSLLLSFRAVTDMLTESLFNASAPEGLATVETGPGPYADMVRLALVIVMLVGFYQIAKGLVLLKRSAEGGDCFWRAVTHIAGGTLCVNIRQFMLVLGASAGGVLRDVVTRLLGS